MNAAAMNFAGPYRARPIDDIKIVLLMPAKAEEICAQLGFFPYWERYLMISFRLIGWGKVRCLK
jgi:hypothetical protein